MSLFGFIFGWIELFIVYFIYFFRVEVLEVEFNKGLFIGDIGIKVNMFWGNNFYVIKYCLYV